VTAKIAVELDVSADERQPTGVQSHRAMDAQFAVNGDEIFKHFL
jgi:hypothetical protein